MSGLILTDDLEVVDGIYVGDLNTIDDIDNASLTVTSQIASIEMQLADANTEARETGRYSDPNWYARTKAALKFKRRILQVLQNRRSAVARQIARDTPNSRSDILLDYFKANYPDLFQTALEDARQRYPSMFRERT